MSDKLDYDNAVIGVLQHTESILVTFSLQNYAAAGAVSLAYFTDQLLLREAAVAVIALGVIFTLVILANLWRYNVLWKMHRIVRDDWLAGQSALYNLLIADEDCKKYLDKKTLSLLTFLPLIVINLLPAVAAIAYWKVTP